MEVAGTYEKFSRTNRASTERVNQLKIQVPDIKKQEIIVKDIRNIDQKIEKNLDIIKEEKKKILNTFAEMFNASEFIKDGNTINIPKEKISVLCDDGRGRVINNEYIDEHPGEYPVYSSQTSNDGIFGYIDTFDFDGEYITWTTDGVNAGTVFYRNGKFNCTNVCGTLKVKESQKEKVDMMYLSVALSVTAPYSVSNVGNNKLMNDAMKNVYVPLPSIEKQKEFSNRIIEINKAITENINKNIKLTEEREKILDKYFRD